MHLDSLRNYLGPELELLRLLMIYLGYTYPTLAPLILIRIYLGN